MKIDTIIDSIINHNFDSGNYVINENIEIAFNSADWNFSVIMTNEIITADTINDLRDLFEGIK